MLISTLQVENEIIIRPAQDVGAAKNKSGAANAVLACQKVLNTFGIRQRPWRGEQTRLVQKMSLDNKSAGEKHE